MILSIVICPATRASLLVVYKIGILGLKPMKKSTMIQNPYANRLINLIGKNDKINFYADMEKTISLN